MSFDASSAAFTNIRNYRDFRFGANLHLVMTGERLYRDNHVVDEAAIAQAQGHDPINGSDSIGARHFVQQAVLQQFEAVKTVTLGRAPSTLGTTQTQWWKRRCACRPRRGRCGATGSCSRDCGSTTPRVKDNV